MTDILLHSEGASEPSGLVEVVGLPLVPEVGPAPAEGVGLEQLEEELECVAIRDVTHDVKTIVLQRDSASPLTFLPGQYLTVTVDVDGERLQRCYSIDSPPTRPDWVTITVKRIPGGPVSGFLHEQFRVGDRLRVAGPYGEFTFGERPSAKYLFLTAGSGITPAMSMTRTLADRGEPADVVFVHNARTPVDIIFRQELNELAALPGFSVTVICEADSPSEAWGGVTGRLTLRTLLRAAPDLHDREVFTCGPPPYMHAVRDLLSLAAVSPDRCHEESFDLAAGADDAADGQRVRTPGIEQYAVQFRRSGRTVQCDADEPVLTAARRAGLSLPSMCSQGMCGTCRTTLVGGQVDMQHAGGISRREVDEGQILTCCSRPLGDVVLDA